nr:integrase, catalytic region, zinc finger, CCHC-type, peptidase aspartic, catalytic [Tanacetum cinerariifolium]
MELYIQGKDHGRIILNSVENGPLVWPNVEQDDGTVKLKTYKELSAKERLQADCDLKSTNIVLQVKLLMKVTSLLRKERECKLYDEFDKFSHAKGETLYDYYLWFAQLINDMNIIQMTMQPVQVNTKFLNSLPPKWGKFVSDVKIARELHKSNYDQLYSYLEQNEAHTNEALLMRERFLDPLALVANYHQPLSHLNNYHSLYTTPCQLNSSSNPMNQATVQDGRVTVQQVQGRQGQNVVGLGSQGNVLGSRGNTSGQPKTDDLDAYDSDCDDISSAKAVLMANLSSCDSNVLFEDKANNESKIVNKSLTAELERYKERVKILEQRFNVDLSSYEKFIDLQMDDMIQMKNTKFTAFEMRIDTLKHTLSKHVKEKESLLTTLNGFKTKLKERESKSIEKEIVLENKNKALENIVKNVIDTAVSKPNATTIAPGMFKIDLEPLAPKVLKNKDAHLDYIKYSREHADILRDIVKSARALSPLDSNLDSACKEIKKVNEKVYAAQVGCEQCKGPHYTKDCPLKEEGKTLKESYYTQFDAPFQGRRYRATASGFYQRNNKNLLYLERKQSIKESQNMSTLSAHQQSLADVGSKTRPPMLEGGSHYARNFSKPRVRDSKYFMEQMLLAKKDKTKVILSNEQNDFLIVDVAQMVEIEELSANICMMARIQNSAFISESQVELFFVYKDPSIDYKTGRLQVRINNHLPMLDLRLILQCLNGEVTYHRQVDSDVISKKKETQKFLNHSIDVGPYEFKMIQPNSNQPKRIKSEDDLMGDDLKQYEAEIEAMNLILISIPNDIYNYMDSCQTANDMWLRDPKDPLTSAMMLLAHAITQRNSTPTNNRLRSSLNTGNQAVMQDERVSIQSKDVVDNGRIAKWSYNVQDESTGGSNVQKETGNIQRNLQTSSARNVTNV